MSSLIFGQLKAHSEAIKAKEAEVSELQEVVLDMREQIEVLAKSLSRMQDELDRKKHGHPRRS